MSIGAMYVSASNTAIRVALNAPAIVRKHLFCMTARLFEMQFDFFYILWHMPYSRNHTLWPGELKRYISGGLLESGAPCGGRNFFQCSGLFCQFFLNLSDMWTLFN